MPDQLQLRGGTTTEHNSFTGASKEVTIDTTKKTAVVHDGSVAGGNPLMREDGANSALIDGSATEPALAFAGNSANTGIYSPGTDQLAVSTNGVERVEWGTSEVVFNDGGENYDFRIEGDTNANLLVVDASTDRIGVGTASPASILHLSGSSDQTYTLQTTTSGADNRINFRNSSGTDAGGIWYMHAGNHLLFNTGGSNQEKVRIDSSGRVGIGTSSPSSFNNDMNDLVVGTGSGSRGISIFSGNTSTGNVLFHDTADTNISGMMRYDHSSNAMSFWTNGANQRLTIDSNGRVGIGTTSLIERLHVNGGVRLDVDNQGLYFNSSTTAVTGNGTNSEIYFGTSNTERARIDSSGRLLVGTSTSDSQRTSRVQIAGNGDLSGWGSSLNLSEFGTSYNPWIALQRSRNSTIGSHTVVNSGDILGGIQFNGSDGNSFESGASIKAEVDATPGDGDMPGRLVFSTTAGGASSPTERMRIESTGVMRHYSPTGGLTCGVSANGSSNSHMLFQGRHSATNVSNGTECFIVFNSGNVQNTNNAYGALSDIKLKENIVNASSQWDDLKAIQVRNYNFKEETGQQTHTQLGVVAQEIELVSPGLVTESPDRDEEGNDLGTTTKSVNYSVLYMKAVKALQEAMERIETLETKVAALEAN